MVAGLEVVDKVPSKDLLGTTEAGKEIYLVHKANCSVRVIAFGSGGQLPEQLQGGFSSIKEALDVTDSYLAKVEAKEIKVDGSKYSGRGKK